MFFRYATCLGGLLGLLFARPAPGQQLFRIQHFSNKYYGTVWLAKPRETLSPGWVAVYDQATGKRLLKVEADELAAKVTKGQVKAGVHELPYGEQSVLQYEDFNFDGIKDLAIEDGLNSCYHGPSFRVYLGLGTGFVFSNSFTELAQEYCGLFEVDKTRKRLSTMTKDGCCWHEFNEYVVRNNAPLLVKSVKEDAHNMPFVETTTQTWNGRAMVSSSATILDLEEDDMKPVFSFKLLTSGKKMVLFSDGEKLGYALLTAAGKVEFNYPASLGNSHPNDFTLDISGTTKTLLFKNGNVQYRLSDNLRNLASPERSIVVVTPTKTVSLPGRPGTGQGSLSRLATLKLLNVTIRTSAARK